MVFTERMLKMRILVTKNDLEERLLRAKNGKWIEFCIVPSQLDEGKLNPAVLHIGTIHNDGTYEDLESICEYRRLKLVDLRA